METEILERMKIKEATKELNQRIDKQKKQKVTELEIQQQERKLKIEKYQLEMQKAMETSNLEKVTEVLGKMIKEV